MPTPLALLLAALVSVPGCGPDPEPARSSPAGLATPAPPTAALPDAPVRSSPTDPDELWARARRAIEPYALFVPGEIASRTVLTRASGKVDEDVTVRSVLDAEGDDLSWTPAQVLEGDRDVTDQYTADEAGALGAFGDDEAALAYPFSPDAQVEVGDDLGPDSLDGRAARRVAYTHRVSGVAWAGVAWLDAQTGRPLRLTLSRPAPYEDTDYNVTVDRLDLTVHYRLPPGPWYPTEVVSESDLQADLSGYTYRARSRTVTQLTAYRDLGRRR